MYFGLYTPADVIEEKGDGYFIAAHPRPREKTPSITTMVLGARHSLVGNWTEDYYQSCVDSFRILNRQMVFVNKPDALKYVLTLSHENYEQKSSMVRRTLEPMIGDSLFINGGELWRKRRPIVADIVHKKRMPTFGPIMETIARERADAWAAKGRNEEFDVFQETAELTAMVINRAVFGPTLSAQDAQQVIDGFGRFQANTTAFNLGYFFGAEHGWRTRLTRAQRESVAQVKAVVARIVDEHIAGGGGSDSMIDLLIQLNRENPDLGLDINAIRNETAMFFLAGHEGTATSLGWVWYLLGNAPWIEREVHAEIDRIAGDRPISVDDLPALDWCRAVVLETMRLYPPVPLLPRQAKAADRIDDVDVEKGALIMISPWLLHRSRDLWDQPNHFRPERFRNGAKTEPYTYIPFGIGPRLCPGMNFGLNEAILSLAILAQRFKVRLRPGYRVEPVCRLTLRPQGGLPVTLEPRQREPVAN